jgi:hypothetical protein
VAKKKRSARRERIDVVNRDHVHSIGDAVRLADANRDALDKSIGLVNGAYVYTIEFGVPGCDECHAISEEFRYPFGVPIVRLRDRDRDRDKPRNREEDRDEAREDIFRDLESRE